MRMLSRPVFSAIDLVRRTLEGLIYFVGGFFLAFTEGVARALLVLGGEEGVVLLSNVFTEVLQY